MNLIFKKLTLGITCCFVSLTFSYGGEYTPLIQDEIPLIPRKIFSSFLGNNECSENELKVEIQTHIGSSSFEITHENHDDLWAFYKTQEEKGARFYYYDLVTQKSIPLTIGVLEEAYPYVHVEYTKGDYIYWSYFLKDEPGTKVFYQFSRKHQENAFLPTPHPLFGICYCDSQQTLYGRTGGLRQAIYVKKPGEEWIKITQENNLNKAWGLEIIPVPLIEKYRQDQKKSDQNFALCIFSLNDKYESEICFLDPHTHQLLPPFFRTQTSIGKPIAIHLKSKHAETQEHMYVKVMFIPEYFEGKYRWCVTIPGTQQILDTMLAMIQETVGDDFYLRNTKNGLRAVQWGNISYDKLNFFLLEDDCENLTFTIHSGDTPFDDDDPFSENTEEEPSSPDPCQVTLEDFDHCFVSSFFDTFKMTNGLPLDCLVTIPRLGHKPYPAVIKVHGGPHISLMLEFDYDNQFLANRGYVVIEPIFSGSTNTYEIFQRGYGQYGGLIQQEMNEAAAWYGKSGLIDANRVGIMGASFGGYVVNFQATHPGKFKDIFLQGFKCFISEIGPSNLPQGIEETLEDMRLNNLIDIPYQICATDPLIQDPYAPLSPEALRSLEENSPVFSADNVQAPLLLLHNAQDKVVPISHSHQLSLALQNRGIPHIYGVFEDEEHSLVNPKNIDVQLGLIENFLYKHLGGGRAEALTQEELDDSTFHFVVGEEEFNLHS